MSPHETTSKQSAALDDLATTFTVTTNGFLPAETPLARIPDAYYQPWETLARDLPKLLREGKLRSAIDNLPILDCSRLGPEPEWRRAYIVLTFLTHAYIWGGETPSERLPPQVTVPVLAVSEHLDLPPVVTYAASNLWNFRTTGAAGDPASFSDLESLDCLLSFTGTPDESWFYIISVAMECEGGDIIPTMLSAMERISAAGTNGADVYTTATAALEQLMACIRRVGRILDRMHERCEPEVFYHAIRPFLAGSKNMQAAGLPRGVFYERGGGEGDWMRLRGGSNGQSSLIQFFDLVLGVEHAATETQNSGAAQERPVSPTLHKSTQMAAAEEEPELPFHEEVRAYMPGPHRRFLAHARALPSIRRFALEPFEAADPLSAEKQLLQETFEHATKVLAEFRNKHLQIVTRYIVVPSRKHQQSQKKGSIGLAAAGTTLWREPPQNPVAVPKNASRDAGASPDGKASKGDTRDRRMSETQLTGTGGTAVMPFLKQIRDETLRAGRPDSVQLT
ncbi:hypothetical protein RB598_004383 [Gaeumannomyces tritici]